MKRKRQAVKRYIDISTEKEYGHTDVPIAGKARIS